MILIETGKQEAYREAKSHPWSNTTSNVTRLNRIAAGLLVLTCALLIWGLLRDKETVRREENARDVSVVIQQLLTTTTNAENGQRGFLITGDESYLAPYNHAFSDLREQIDSLRRLTASDATVQRRIDSFEAVCRQKFLEMDSTIKLRREAGEDAARGIVASNKGQQLMNQIRMLTSEISAGAEPAIRTRLRESRNSLIRLLGMACGTSLLCVCCLVIATRTGKQILVESEERFHLLADYIPSLAFIGDRTGWIFWYNKRWYDYTGKTEAEMQGWGWQSVHDPKILPEVLKLWSASIASGEPFRMELPLLGADGTFRMFLARVLPWRDKDGNIFRWFGTNIDINDLAETQKELRRVNEELEVRIAERTAELVSTNKELESFAYSISHDLRAPLRHLDAFADLLRRACYDQIDSKAQRYLDKITASAQNMGRLIDDLLAFSRLLRTEVTSARVSLMSLQEEVRSDMESDVAGRNIVWTIGKLPDVYGDRAMLGQVFANLLSNAVKYSRDREEAHIEIGCAGSTDEETTIFVRDNGVGFDMKYVDKLFGVFERLHSDGFEGTGVGLAIVRRLIERHGGSVWAEGAPDQGATFYCSLPNKQRGQA